MLVIYCQPICSVKMLARCVYFLINSQNISTIRNAKRDVIWFAEYFTNQTDCEICNLSPCIVLFSPVIKIQIVDYTQLELCDTTFTIRVVIISTNMHVYFKKGTYSFQKLYSRTDKESYAVVPCHSRRERDNEKFINRERYI